MTSSRWWWWPFLHVWWGYVIVPFCYQTKIHAKSTNHPGIPKKHYRKWHGHLHPPHTKPQFLVPKKALLRLKILNSSFNFPRQSLQKTRGAGLVVGSLENLVAGINQNKDKPILSGKINTRSFFRFGKSVYESRPYVHPFRKRMKFWMFFPLFKGAISKAKYSYPSTIFSWDMMDMLVFGGVYCLNISVMVAGGVCNLQCQQNNATSLDQWNQFTSSYRGSRHTSKHS